MLTDHGLKKPVAITRLTDVYALKRGSDAAVAVWGLEGWSADGRHRWFGEYAETGCRMPVGKPGEKGCAYRNYAYADGYTHGGRWLGAAAGPDSICRSHAMKSA